MLEGADLLRHDPSRLRLWFGQEDFARAGAEDVIGIDSVNECGHTCRESAFTTSRSARDEISVAEPVVFVGTAQKFKRRLGRKSHSLLFVSGRDFRKARANRLPDDCLDLLRVV